MSIFIVNCIDLNYLETVKHRARNNFLCFRIFMHRVIADTDT